MMKKPFILLFLILFTNKIIADDGVFFAQGDNLIPLEETNIELQKEILILDRQSGSNPKENRNLNVNIYFEFYNPNSEVEKFVGFVTPPASNTSGLVITKL